MSRANSHLAFLVSFLAAVWLSAVAGSARAADDPIFSGPQVGEKLPPLKVLGVYDDVAGKELDLVAAADGGPVLLIFVHELTRPSAMVTRLLSEYALTRAEDGLSVGIVWLAADRSAAEQYLKRARNSLRLKAPLGISPDGAEGPGSYGLNRKVTLTILVGNEGKVTANYALVQPSATEVPTILADVVKLVGGKAPTLAQLQPRETYARPAAAGGQIPRELLAPVIQKDATPEDVARYAADVEEFVGDNKARQRALGEIASRVVSSGRLANYGTPAAQEKLKQWAKKYGPPEAEKKE